MRIFIVLVLSLMLLPIYSCKEKNDKVAQKIVYVDSYTIFEGFQMKKDYDLKIESDLKASGLYLDSLTIQIENFDDDTLGLYKARTDYYVAKQTYDRKFEQLSGQYTKEVNNRLNKYISEFAKANKYSMVLSSQAQGSILYVAEADNVTEDLLSFINKKYSK